METSEQKKRRLFGKLKQPGYLEELSCILNFQPKAENLLSIVETDLVRNSCKTSESLSKNVIGFDDKEELVRIMQDISSKESTNYFAFIKDSEDCGTIKIDLLKDFYFNFRYDAVRSGIVSFIQEDLKKSIVLDFYEENGVAYVEIESFLRVAG